MQSSPGIPSLSKTSDPTITKVATHELIPLAQSIAAVNIDVPLEIIYIAKDVISGRQRCLSWYHELAQSNDVGPEVLASNRTHKHFLAQLQEVHDILLDTYRARQPESNVSPRKFNADLEKMKNSFQYLNVEEPAEVGVEEAIEFKSDAKMKTSKGVKQTASYDLDDEQEEKSFAIFCLFQDFADLREQTCNLWMEYKSGDLSFMTACLLTNTAFKMYHRAAGDFSEAYSDLSTFEDILELSGIGEYLAKARTACCDEGEDVIWTSDARDDSLCMKAWATLRDFKDVAPWLLTTEDARRGAGVPRVRFPGHPFSKALIGIVKDLIASITSIPTGAAANNMDVFTMHLVLYMAQPADDPMPIGLVGMTSAYIGIYDVLKGDMEQGLSESDRALNRIHDAATAFRKFLAAGHKHKSFESIDEVLTSTRKGSNHWELRFASPANQAGIQFSKQVLGTLPVLSGMHAMKMAKRFHLMALAYCNSDSALLTLAHLYKASKEQGLLTSSWPSLDLFIANQKAVKLVDRTRKTFCGDVSPSNQKPALSRARQYVMSLGISLEQAYRATPADHPDIPPTSMATRPISTSHFLVGAEHLASRAKKLGHKPQLSELYYDIVRRLVKSGQPIQDRVVAEAWQRSKSLTNKQMLIALQQAIVASEQDINTNYLALFETCAGILVELFKWGAQKGNVDMSTLLSFQDIGAFTLWQAAQYEDSVSRQRSSQRRGLLLRKVAQSIASFVESGADNLRENSRKVSSGFIAECLKPSVLYPAERAMQYAIVDFGGIVFNHISNHQTAEEAHFELDAGKGALSSVMESFERDNLPLRSEEITAERLQDLQAALQARLYQANLTMKANVALVDGRLVPSVRDFSEEERKEILMGLPRDAIIEVLKRGVDFVPGVSFDACGQ